LTSEYRSTGENYGLWMKKTQGIGCGKRQMNYWAARKGLTLRFGLGIVPPWKLVNGMLYFRAKDGMVSRWYIWDYMMSEEDLEEMLK
jgi:hypothetical protein